MNADLKQAIGIVEQAVVIACKNEKLSLADLKNIIAAWDYVKAELNKPKDACPIEP